MSVFNPQDQRMQRSRGQVLFRYRPGQTFDHPGAYVAQVRGYGADPIRDRTDVDPDYLIDAAMRLVRRWRADGRAAQPGVDRAPEFPPEGAALARDQYEILEPGRVFCRLWPRTVRCANQACGMVWTAAEPAPGVDPWPPPCPRCHRSDGNRQLQYVFVHPCGEVAEMRPPDRCRACGSAQFRLADAASRFMDFRWECVRCRASQAVVDFCQNRAGCRYPDAMMAPLVHTASTAYLGQGMTVVNPRTVDLARMVGRPEFVVATIGRWLGTCSEKQARQLLDAATADAPDPAVLESIRLMESSGVLELVAQARQLRDRFVPSDLADIQRDVTATLGYDPLADDRGRALAERLEPYQRVLSLPRISLAGIRGRAASAVRASRYDAYGPALERAGLTTDGSDLVTEFPVVYLAVGYSRGGFGPREADLVPYRARAGRGQATKTLIYTSRVDTEALVFRLDEARVSRWLQATALATPEELAGGVRRWLAEQTQGFDDQLPPGWDPETWPDAADPQRGARALVGLLHSFAHQIIRALAVDSGFSEEALSEYLFPLDLAFAVYPNGGSEFTIGALRSVYEQNLDEIVSRAVETDTCLYDPNCMIANHGSDHGCLQLAETSCQWWNWFLSRWHLYGEPGSGVPGYWTATL